MMNELKTFHDLYYFLIEDFGNFLLFGHILKKNGFYTENMYTCEKCDLTIQSSHNEILLWDQDDVGEIIVKSILLSDRLPTCEKRCNEKIIKNIIE